MGKETKKILTIINIFIVIASVLVCSLYAVKYYFAKEYFQFMSCFIIMVLPIIIYILEVIIRRGISEITKMIYLIFIFISGVIGAAANLYGYVQLYDKAMHFISGLLLTGLFIVIFNKFYEKKKDNVKVLIFSSICFNSTIALLWEILEFVLDLIFNNNIQRGLSDTMTDMIISVIAGIIITLIYVIVYKKYPNISKILKVTGR